MTADLNKLYDITTHLTMAEARDREERQRVDLRRYLERAVLYLQEREAAGQDEWTKLLAECNALFAIIDAGQIAERLYTNHVLPRAQAAAPPPPPRRERRDVEAYEDRLDAEGYSS